MADQDQTASLMTPAKLAAMKRPKAVVSPGVWLDQMAADAGQLNLQRISQLRGVLEIHSRTRHYAPMAAALDHLAKTLPQLDFSLLAGRGWWARTTGKSRTGGAVFTAQFERINEGLQALAVQTGLLLDQSRAGAGPAERALIEFEVEFQALDKVAGQGERWLLDMRKQTLSPADDNAARCAILEVRLKLLRGAIETARSVHGQARTAAAGPQALLQMLQHRLAGAAKAWQVRLSEVAAMAGDDAAPALSLEGSADAHRALQLCVRRAAADCTGLETHEEALATNLRALERQPGLAG